MIYPTVQKVIDILETVDPEKFNMEDADSCIAGHCRSIGFGRVECCDTIFESMTGIDHRTAVEVVYPDSDESTMIGCEATLPQAIKMLEILRDTGAVDWHQAMA